MKSDKELAIELATAMDKAATKLEEAQLEVIDIYSAAMLYAYDAWLGKRPIVQRISSKEMVQQFLEEEASNL
jgi:hypothetical protein